MEHMIINDKPLISIIVPVYNVESYLEQCVNSIINQSYPNTEIILVDDGSDDESGDMCDVYQSKHRNIKVIHKKNEGLGFARNSGLEICEGMYVTFIDSDDWVGYDLIQNMYDAMVTNSIEFCKSGFQRVRNNGKIISIRSYENIVYDGDRASKELLPRMIGALPGKHDSIEMCVCAALYKTDIICKNHIRFPSERELISEDLVFNIDYMQYAKGACTIDKVNYNYRMNDVSLTHKYRSDRFDASVYFYSEMRKKLETLGYGEETILRLDKTFFNYARMSIAQEKGAVSGHDMLTSIRNIYTICDSTTLRYVIREYPIKELGFKQRLFLQLVKRNKRRILFYFAEMGLLD